MCVVVSHLPYIQLKMKSESWRIEAARYNVPRLSWVVMLQYMAWCNTSWNWAVHIPNCMSQMRNGDMLAELLWYDAAGYSEHCIMISASRPVYLADWKQLTCQHTWQVGKKKITSGKLASNIGLDKVFLNMHDKEMLSKCQLCCTVSR